MTDLIENFESHRVRSRWLKWLMHLGGVTYPHGGTPRDLMLTFLKKRSSVRSAMDTIIGWQPERVIIAHGRCIEFDAARELHRLFRWAGGSSG